MFKGFNVQYTDYEVITPQTKLSYNVRSLNVQEEEKLKGSLISSTKITEHLNKCIFDAITKKPTDVINYDSFLKSTTLKDRDALLYGLYHITYEEIRNYDIRCSSCRKEYPVTIQASDTFSMNSYPGEDILKKEAEVELPKSKGVYAFIRQPTLHDEMVALKTLGVTPGSSMGIITESLIITRFHENPAEGDSIVYSERDDIIDAYLSLPSKDKREIYKRYKEEFGQYGIELKMISSCIHCGNQEEIDIDLVENFFRMVHSV